jgi:hypothetical protein
LDDDGSYDGEASEISGPLDSLIFGVGELLDKIDDGSPKLCVRDYMKALMSWSPSGVAR